MNCEKCKELLVAYVEDLLDESQKQAIESHLKSCPPCRAEADKIVGLRERLITNGKALAQSDLEEKVLHRIVQERSWRLKKISKSSRQIQLWREIMKSRITKLAAAAIVIIAVIVGIYYSGGSVQMAGVAWGEVLRNVEKAQSFMFQHQWIMKTAKATTELNSVIYNASEYGIRRDMYVNEQLLSIAYVPPTGNVITEVLPQMKKYALATLTEQQLTEMHEQVNPRQIVKEFMSFEHTELGRDTINGIEVEGIEVDDPKFGIGLFERGVGRLWVDVRTNLPVRIELEGVAGGGSMEMKIVAYDFEWDVELGASDFEPNIPADYTLLAKVDISADEETAIKGLRIFAEFTDGRYPSNLALMTVMKEAGEALKKKLASDPDWDPETEPTPEQLAKVPGMGQYPTIQAASMFYAKLLDEDQEQDRDIAYYGGTVTADDSEAVLMRWKLSNGQYRVIFGDLTVETVTAERLAELESGSAE